MDFLYFYEGGPSPYKGCSVALPDTPAPTTRLLTRLGMENVIGNTKRVKTLLGNKDKNAVVIFSICIKHHRKTKNRDLS